MNEAIQALSSQCEQIEKVIDAVPSSIFEQIDSLINKLLSAEKGLERGYAKFGLLLTEVSERELWREAEFKSFDKYLETLQEKYHRGRTMLWSYFSAVREMKPYLSEEQMDKMGISKLGVLKKATKQLGFPPNQEVIDTALDPEKTVSDVRKSVAQNHKLAETEQDGIWFELPGFFVTPDEKLVIESAFENSWRTDPVVQKSVKESVRAKEGLLRMSMEYNNTYASAVEEGIA